MRSCARLSARSSSHCWSSSVSRAVNTCRPYPVGYDGQERLIVKPAEKRPVTRGSQVPRRHPDRLEHPDVRQVSLGAERMDLAVQTPSRRATSDTDRSFMPFRAVSPLVNVGCNEVATRKSRLPASGCTGERFEDPRPPRWRC
jgi:hypothetical protein